MVWPSPTYRSYRLTMSKKFPVNRFGAELGSTQKHEKKKFQNSVGGHKGNGTLSDHRRQIFPRPTSWNELRERDLPCGSRRWCADATAMASGRRLNLCTTTQGLVSQVAACVRCNQAIDASNKQSVSRPSGAPTSCNVTNNKRRLQSESDVE